MKPWLIVQTTPRGVFHVVDELTPTQGHAASVLCRPGRGDHSPVVYIEDPKVAEGARICRRCRRIMGYRVSSLERGLARLDALDRLATSGPVLEEMEHELERARTEAGR